MTYNDGLIKTEMGKLPEFYDISFADKHERYTNNETDLVFNVYSWTAAPIERTSFTRDDDFNVLETTITTIPTDLLRLYAANVPVEPVKILIYRALAEDLSKYALLFSGIVKTIQFSNGLIQAKCEAQSQHLKKKVPHFLYQSFCNHCLYDSGCGLNKNAWKVSGELVYVSGTTLKINEAANKADGYFDQGMIQVANDKRLILKHTGNTLIVHTPFSANVSTGMMTYIFPGCTKDPKVCKDKFDNLENFLGHPYIPTRNPVLGGYR